jgi:hypothetical protein
MGRARKTRHSPAGRARPSRATARPAPPHGRRDVPLVVSVVAALLVLAALGDDRHTGLIADGRQMIRTAVAIAETGEIGQARGRDFTVERAAGDNVSRFGMATSLLQVPAAWAAGPVEARLGPGRSQALFLILPWLMVGMAAGAAGWITRRLGGSDAQVVSAVLLASLASPLGSYALLEFSEPVQAAALTAALALALAAATSPRERGGLAFAAGAAAGFAVLAKSSLILAAPATLLPLVDPGARARTARALLRAAAGAAGPLAVWTVFEVIRFGQLFGGYPDDRFTHPWGDGAWRLLVGPNRGLLLFWPALLLVIWSARPWVRAPLSTPAARAWLAATIVLITQLAVAAGYWGWHGMEGWGPRLVLAAVPLLAPFAALAPVPRLVLAGAVALSLAINLPPLLQHPTPVATYVMNLRWPVIRESDAPRYPFYATARAPSGEPTVIPFAAIELERAANPWRLYPWIWRASHLEPGDLARALREPPWRSARPDLVPDVPWPPEVARQVVPPPRLGFLGRSLTGTGGPYATAYLDAVLDQVVRANQQGRVARALALSERRRPAGGSRGAAPLAAARCAAASAHQRRAGPVRS